MSTFGDKAEQYMLEEFQYVMDTEGLSVSQAVSKAINVLAWMMEMELDDRTKKASALEQRGSTDYVLVAGGVCRILVGDIRFEIEHHTDTNEASVHSYHSDDEYDEPIGELWHRLLPKGAKDDRE